MYVHWIQNPFSKLLLLSSSCPSPSQVVSASIWMSKSVSSFSQILPSLQDTVLTPRSSFHPLPPVFLFSELHDSDMKLGENLALALAQSYVMTAHMPFSPDLGNMFRNSGASSSSSSPTPATSALQVIRALDPSVRPMASGSSKKWVSDCDMTTPGVETSHDVQCYIT